MRLSAKKKALLAVLGAAAGFINGFLGGGGGVLVVALMLAVLCLPQKNAQATALLAILPLTAISAAVYFLRGSVGWQPTLWTSAGVAAGGILGAWLLSGLKSNTAKIIFAVILVAGGIKMLF